jgi:hypothetical protein
LPESSSHLVHFSPRAGELFPCHIRVSVRRQISLKIYSS